MGILITENTYLYSLQSTICGRPGRTRRRQYRPSINDTKTHKKVLKLKT